MLSVARLCVCAPRPCSTPLVAAQQARLLINMGVFASGPEDENSEQSAALRESNHTYVHSVISTFVRDGLVRWGRRQWQNFALAGARSSVSIASTPPGAMPRRIVGAWLLGCGGMVFGAVVLGGVTRLTESGLSMVTWRLLGEHVPRTPAEWRQEFQRYQQFPEFKMLNQEMTLEQFQRIWWMEYIHRMWGRAIGAAFLLPAAAFWAKGWLTPPLKKRVVAFGALILLQGLMGWYMVQSGLEDRFQAPSEVPRVSQYRLATHLSLAFVLYTLLLWSGLELVLPAQTMSGPVSAAARRFRWLAHSCKGAVFLTAVSGAFVAGLDAGLIYNSFPKMAEHWVPEDILAFSPALRNFTENPTTVQFDHRVLGTTSLALVTTMWAWSRRLNLPPRARLAATAAAIMMWTQVGLGITTLLMYVPVPLAASHQSGSLLVLSFMVWLTHELRRLPK